MSSWTCLMALVSSEMLIFAAGAACPILANEAILCNSQCSFGQALAGGACACSLSRSHAHIFKSVM